MPWEGSGLAGGGGGGGTPGNPGSVCPQGWDEDFDRSQMSTQVLIGRSAPQNVPVLAYTWSPAAGAIPPPSGTINLNGDQSGATRMYVHRTTRTGVDASIWLAYLNLKSSVAIKSADNKQRTYRFTAAPIEFPAYFELPIQWTEGTEAVLPGDADMILTIGSEIPQLWVDTYGRDHYGRMTFNRTDLINTDRAIFETLADRILEVRGSNSVPRLEAVTIDARTSPDAFPLRNMELMSSAAPEKPSRYLMRLNVNGRLIFDRMCFATAVRHFIARDEWTLRITLDIAEWAAQL